MLLNNVMLASSCLPAPSEKRRPLAVDAFVQEPIFGSTHAITIDAPPERVWPWIAEMGAGRAGWYSWDAIDNGGAPISTRIVPELQSTRPTHHPRFFIERVYAALAMLPGPVLVAVATLGHRIMEARHLRGIQRRSTAASARRSRASGETWRKALLVCGVVSSLLYASMIWGIRYEGYNPISQVPSELTAIGAPTQALWARLGWIYTVLMTAFGIGVWRSAGGNRAVRLVGGLMLAYASLGLLWPFAAMHQREVLAVGGGTLSDTLHVALGALTVFLMFLAIGFGATAFGKRFRLYSIATIVVLLAFGGLTFLEAPQLQMNLPTPWIGLWERMSTSARSCSGS